MRKILLYGFQSDRLNEISKVMDVLNFSKYCRFLEESDLNQKVGYLLGSNGFLYEEKNTFNKDISNVEFVYFAGFDRTEVFSVIDYMKEHSIERPVFSMITPTNIEWIVGNLIYEVHTEHIEMTKGAISSKED